MNVPHAAADDPDVVSKSEFARLTNVSPPRVTQWIEEKKIHGAGLVGEGRAARIRVSVACAQLRRSLDVVQRIGGNGLGTKLDFAAPRPEGDGQVLPFAPSPVGDPVEEQIKRARLEQLERGNRKTAREEAESTGRLIDAAVASQQMGRIAAQMLAIYEGRTQETAAAIAAKYNLPQRDVVHLLRAEQRKRRLEAAAMMKRAAADMPEALEFELGEPAAEALPAADDEPTES